LRLEGAWGGFETRQIRRFSVSQVGQARRPSLASRCEPIRQIRYSRAERIRGLFFLSTDFSRPTSSGIALLPRFLSDFFHHVRNFGCSGLPIGFLLLAIGAPDIGYAISWPASTATGIAQAGSPGSLVAGYEPSGAAWHPRLEVLLIVGDDGHVSQITASGGILSTWLPGGDLEGIAIADSSSDLVYLGRESPDGVLEFDLSTGTLTGSAWDLTPWMTGAANQGLEALTVVDGLFYAGHQGEGSVYVFDLQPGGVVQFIESFTAPFGRTDLSGLHFQPQTATLYGVHDSFNVLVEMETDGTFIQEFDLPRNNQEGITLRPDCAINESAVFVAEDSGAVVRYDDYPSTCIGLPVPSVSPAGLAVLTLLLAAGGQRLA